MTHTLFIMLYALICYYILHSECCSLWVHPAHVVDLLFVFKCSQSKTFCHLFSMLQVYYPTSLDIQHKFAVSFPNLVSWEFLCSQTSMAVNSHWIMLLDQFSVAWFIFNCVVCAGAPRCWLRNSTHSFCFKLDISKSAN